MEKHQGFDFGQALRELKAHVRVQRLGWNGKGMFLVFVGADDWNADSPGMGEEEGSADTAPFIAMKTADNKLVPWLASQTDMLAEDWVIYKLRQQSPEYWPQLLPYSPL